LNGSFSGQRPSREPVLSLLADANLLGRVLLQLSPYFKYDSPSLNALTGFLAAVSADKCDYAVEFRRQSWLD
jgi:uncharacterized protein YecE (DUF72 family)